MVNILIRKGLVLGIIVLFVGVCVVPIINWNMGNTHDVMDVAAEIISDKSGTDVSTDIMSIDDTFQKHPDVDISVIQAKEMIEENQDVIILDVRDPDEYNSGHIEGAISIPLIELDCESCLQKMLNQHKEENIIVYCKTGVRSKEACNILLNSGFNHVYNIEDGINAWNDAGFPISLPDTNQSNEWSYTIDLNADVSSNPLTSEIDDILNSYKIPVFVFFYVEWCHFCRQQLPIIDELEEEYTGKIAFIRINAEENPQALNDFGVTGFPAMFLRGDKL